MTEIQQLILFTALIVLAGFPLSFFGLRYFLKETVTFKTIIVLIAVNGLISILVYGGSLLSFWHLFWEVPIAGFLIYAASITLKRIYNDIYTEIEDVMQNFSKGNFEFAKSIEYENRTDRTGKIIKSIAIFENRVLKIFEKVQNDVIKIEDVQTKMNNTSFELNSFASKQADSIILIADSAEQLVNTITSYSKQAEEAYSKTKKAVIKTQINDKNVKNSIQSLMDISSKITIISDIAFQTHLLSLNAAIEAAKVNQGGEGFKAVAQQIRKLSEKSSGASKEIAGMVKKSNAVAERTQRISKQILPEVSAASNIVKKISTQGKTQISGAEVINQSIKSISKTSNFLAENAKYIDVFSKTLGELTIQIKDNIKFTDIKSEEINSADNTIKTDKEALES